MPGINTSQFIPDSTSFSTLPFVYRSRDDSSHNSNWHVPPARNYAQACQRGRNYAAHFVRYLQAHGYAFGVNALGYIVKDIDFSDESTRKGYWVGFFSYLERLLHAQARNIDVFADVMQLDAGLATAGKVPIL
jgi:hypothetical protein